MALKPADMESCEKKERCLYGENEGTAYTPGDECESGYTFNLANCDCDPLNQDCFDDTVGSCTLSYDIEWPNPVAYANSCDSSSGTVSCPGRDDCSYGNSTGFIPYTPTEDTTCFYVRTFPTSTGASTECPDPRYNAWVDIYAGPEGFDPNTDPWSSLTRLGGTIYIPSVTQMRGLVIVDEPVATLGLSCSKAGTWRFDGTITKLSGGTTSVSQTFSVNEGDTFGVISDVETSPWFLPVPNTFIDGNTDITVTRSDVGCTGGGVGFYVRRNYSGGGGINYYLGSGEMFCSAAEGSQCSITGTFTWLGA